MNPTILFIDDDQSWPVTAANALKSFGAACVVRTPEELTLQDILASHLVLVDYDLQLAPTDCVYRNVPDGVALASILRRQISKKSNHPIGFALLSGKLDELSFPLPPTERRQQLARHNNLEWVFGKDDLQLNNHLLSLANAVALIPNSWADGIDGLPELAGPLAIDPKARDAETCVERLERCCPPVGDFSLWTHGLAFVRWLLHSILPYPCFLSDLRQLALRWRVDYEHFESAFDSSEPMRNFFSPALYSGMLSDFDGPRWWLNRIERLAWEKTGGNSLNADLLVATIKAETGIVLKSLDLIDPVICHEEDLKPVKNFIESSQCCRIRPDGWPPYAEPAWARINAIKESPKLRSIVHPDDAHRLAASV